MLDVEIHKDTEHFNHIEKLIELFYYADSIGFVLS